MSALLIMLGLLLLSLFIEIFALFAAGKLLRYPRHSFLRAAGLITGFSVVSVGLTVGIHLLPRQAQSFASAIACGVFLIGMNMAIRRLFGVKPIEATVGVVLVVVSQTVIIVLICLVARPFLIESFTCPNISMMPTIRPAHYVCVCPNCGGPLLVECLDPRMFFGTPPKELRGLCPDCLQSSSVPTATLTSAVIPADRFFVTKFLTPKRWDLEAFRFETEIYLKRVVGLPNETVAIDARGVLFINGAPAGTPPDLPKLVFHPPNVNRALLATAETPLHLGPDEYFVVGDNAESSYDSRLFGPIHAADLRGVATLIYWPLDRFHIVR